MKEELLKNEEEVPQFESLIQGLIDQQFGCEDNFLDQATVLGLRENLLRHQARGEMYAAGVGGRFERQQNAEVRGDQIKWIDNEPTDPFEVAFISKAKRLIAYLNQTCYTSLNDFEFHYASYAPLSFYKRHLDQFKKHKGRKYSLVVYLNDQWQESDGGNLSLYLENGREESIYPLGGRAVFFESHLVEHEVHPSLTRSRISIAGWLKSI